MIQHTIVPIRRGFTLIELVTALSISGVLTLTVATLLVAEQKHWNVLYERTHGQETADSFAVQRILDNICRNAGAGKILSGADATSLELYYWDRHSTSPTPENYARLFVDTHQLVAEHGRTLSDRWMPDSNQPTRRQIAAQQVDRVHFSVIGPSVRMTVYYQNDTPAPSVYSSLCQNP